MYGIEIFAYTFLSNHYHLLVRAPRGNLWLFAQAINREIARRINFYRKREGTVWARRYDVQIVIEEPDQLEALLYIVCNAVGHGLVRHPKHWPGLSSYHQLRTGKARRFRFKKYSLKNQESVHELLLTPLPALGCSTLAEQWTVLENEIRKRVRLLHSERGKKPFLGKAKILKQNPFSRPKEVKRSARPLCYTKSLQALHWFRRFYRQLKQVYIEASYRYRRGEFPVCFPPLTFPPPAHCVPA